MSTPAERALRRQRDALLDALQSLVTMGNLGWCPGADNVEIHVDHVAKAERTLKRIRKQITTTTTTTTTRN